MSRAPPQIATATDGSRPTVELSADGTAWVRLLYVEDGGKLWVVPSAPESDWFSRAAREGRAWLRLRDATDARVVGATASREATNVARVHALGRQRYGTVVWDSYFGGVGEVLLLDPGTAPSRLTSRERLRREFDRSAPTYDRGLELHPVERYLKERAAVLLEHALAGHDPLLEIGPGTGFHTLRLLAGGHHVLAIDPSRGMLDELTLRAHALGVDARLETRELSFADVGERLRDLSDGHFGGVCSAFGAFDLEPEIGRAAAALPQLVAPGGVLAFTALNRPGLVPMVWELLAGRPGAAFRRTRTLVPEDGIGYPLELFLRTPKGWDSLLAPGFHRLGAVPISVLAPPFRSARLEPFLGDPGGTRARRLDERLSSHPSLAFAAEWLFLSYARTDAGAPANVGSR